MEIREFTHINTDAGSYMTTYFNLISKSTTPWVYYLVKFMHFCIDRKHNTVRHERRVKLTTPQLQEAKIRKLQEVLG